MLQGNSVQSVIVSFLQTLAAHWSRAETGQISRGTELHCCCSNHSAVVVVVVGLHICCWCHPQLHWSSGGHWSFSASLGSGPSLQRLKADSWLRPAPRRAERLRGGLRIQDRSQNWKPEICVGSQIKYPPPLSDKFMNWNIYEVNWHFGPSSSEIIFKRKREAKKIKC